MRIMVSAPYMQREWDKVAPWFDDAGLDPFLPTVDERMSEDELLAVIGDVDGTICGDDRFTPKVIDAATRLKVIVKWGTGIDSIDKEYAARKGIPVCRTPGAFTEPVSDSALAYILAFSRQILTSDRLVKSGDWAKPAAATLAELTVGIVGFGAIGRRVAEKLAPFGGTILANDILPMDQDAFPHVRFADLPDLLRRSDMITLHCDLNPTSHYIIDDHSLALTKPGAVIVNTARGPLIREVAIAKALAAGGIGGVALDVFEQEPLPATSTLRDYDNVLLAAHASNASPLCWQETHESSFRQMLDVLRRAAA